MPVYNAVFYDFATTNTFSTSTGGFYTYAGPATATGTASITDNEAGVGGQNLDDDNAGGELATANVTVGGNTSTGTTVDAELAWTVRDTVTGETFQVVQFDVENGGASGQYMLSEIPLVPGRSYETLAYDNNPNADAGDPAFNYNDHANSAFFGDNTVSGTSGNDVIDETYVDTDGDTVTAGTDTIEAGAGNDTVFGGGGNDDISGEAGNDFLVGDQTAANDGQDTISGGDGDDVIYGDTAAGTDNSPTVMSWANQGVADEANVAGGVTGVSADGNVQVNMTVAQESNFGSASMETNDALFNYNGVSDTSSIYVEGASSGTSGSNSNSATVTLDFSAAEAGYSDEVSNVTFGIFDIDELNGQFIDQVIVTAYDANGNAIPVTVTLGSTITLTSTTNANGSQTVTSIVDTNGGGNTNSQTGFAQFSVAGPVSYIEIDYNNLDTNYGNHAIRIGDVTMTPIPAAPEDGNNDTLTGDAGNDVIYGQGGDDSIDGGTGSDSLYGGLGNDIINDSGTTSDYIEGGAGNDSISAGAGNDTVYGGADNDTIAGGAGADLIYGGTGQDSISGGSGEDRLYGGDGADTLDGDGGNDSIYGGAGNDVLIGDGGRDSLFGGTGDDGIYASSGNNTVEGGDGNDSIYMGTGNDVVSGGNNNDSIYGGAGNDQLSGDAGNDRLEGGDGNDTLTGGTGNDSVIGGQGSDRIVLGNGFGTDTIDGSEDLGDTDIDVLDASTMTSDITLNMSAADPEAGTLTSGGNTATFDNIETVTLGFGDDSVIGSSGNDSVTAGDGADTINMGAGDDTINLGAGTPDLDQDVIILQDGFGNDTVSNFDAPTPNGDGTFTGIDTLDTTNLFDLPFGDPDRTPVMTNDVVVTDDGAGNALLTFPNGETITLNGITPTEADNPFYLNAIGIPMPDGTVSGTAGDDIIDGSYTGDPDGDMVDGDDAILAGDTDNDDLIFGYAGDDVITAGDGDDEVYGGSGDDTFVVTDNQGDDTIVGGETGETDGDLLDMTSATSDITVSATGDEAGTASVGTGTVTYSEIEQLSTGSGNDVIEVWGANESMTINANDGDDRIVGTLATDEIYGGAGNDVINGAEGDDYIEGNGGDDAFFLTEDFGNYTIVGGETDETIGDIVDTSLNPDAVTVNMTGDEAGTVTDGTNTTTFSEIEQLILGAGDDSVTGSTGDDSVTAGTGADTLNMGAGNDTVDLGDGSPDGDQDVIILQDGFGNDTVDSFDAPTPNGDGTFTGIDTLDTTNLFDLPLGDPDRTPVMTNDVVVTDDGSGNALLTFPNGETITLNGISPTDADNPFYLNAIGIPMPDGTVSGTAGDDLINGSYTGDPDGDIVDNDDAIIPSHSVNDDLIEAGAGNDTIYSGTGNDTIYAGTGDDSVYGGTGDELVFGEAGNDFIVTSIGNDTIDGGTGNDVIFGGAGTDSIDGGTGNDVINGGVDDDTLTGGDDADRFVQEANFGDDTITGGEGGLDNDTIWSTQGVDTTTVLTGDEAGTLTDGTNTATFTEIEVVNVGGGNDTVDASASDADITVYGNAGEDTITGSTADDVLYGGNDNDTIDGGTGADSIYGGFGDDTIEINDDFGADTIIGGESAETVGDNIDGSVLTEDVTVTFTGAEAGGIDNGTDTATFAQIEQVETGSGDDTIIGSTGDQDVITGAGDDTVTTTGTGADTIQTGAGNDTITFSEGDSIDGGTGDDTFIAEDLGEPTNGVITIVGGSGGETLDDSNPATLEGDTLQLGTAADLSTLVQISDGPNADGNETFHGSVTMDDGTILNFSEIENIICFTPGARIATPMGARDIATLKVGDLVVTRDHGLQPIRWIQSRTVPAMDNFAPIRIKPGVVTGQERDLLVSPQHRMMFQGYRAELLFGESEVLVAAKHLVDGADVTQEVGGTVTYIHMLFDEHEVVYAEGAATESFHPGVMGLTAISDPAREELFALFPELRSNPNGYGQTARRFLKRHESELLVR